jgi:hypothetical protein
VWAQYCLYFFIRVQDDLFDGQTEDLSLVFASDQFVIEAERVLSQYFAPSSPLWRIFRSGLKDTTRAILDVDRLQRRLGGPPAELLAGYAIVASIFKVGTAAMCLRLRRHHDLQPLGRFGDEMAIAGQILDDLEDVSEDWRRQRFNYVAKLLLRNGVGSAGSQPQLKELLEEIYLRDGGGRVLALAREHLERAASAIAKVDCNGAQHYVANSIKCLRELEAAFHRAQVQRVLGPILARRPGRRVPATAAAQRPAARVQGGALHAGVGAPVGGPQR